MIFRFALSGSLLAFALLAGSATLPSSQALAYACKNSPTQAVGVHKLKVAAMKKSRTNWTNSTKTQFGLSWSVWTIADGKSVTCNKTGSNWTCLANAKPCNYVVQ